ncbi:uncharacterized protein LOC129942243 [Eupeodes corollae]|uniref:uncharacterized protein LOC129942243 n=1 Tax=Eupeodes corollae TaxID=290404 RepID=UPI0024917569|nr:uncharacterized protein LOC129942243 [Eupeodes corollae]
MTARFRSKIRNITILQCYAPANEATEEDKTAFYTHLNSVYSSVPRADIIIFMEDLNAQVGADNHGLERFWEKMAWGHIMKITCNKVTWVHPVGHTENQIDHVMIQQRWRKSMCDVRNIRNSDVGSDHHLVVMSLKLKTAAVLRQSQNAARNPKFNTNALRDHNISRSYINTLDYRASSLNVSVDSDVDEMWKDHFCAVLNEDPVEQSAEEPQLNEMRRSYRGIDLETPSVSEIETAISLLKNNKQVPAQFLKANPATAASILHPLIQTVWENETYPREWKD